MKNKSNLLLIILIILLIGSLIWFGLRLEIESLKCVSSPLTYGAEKLKEANSDTEFTCSCSFNHPGSVLIEFDSENITTKNINEMFS